MSDHLLGIKLAMSIKGVLRKTVISLIVLFLILHTGVYLARDIAVQWLLDQGAEKAELQHLGINWFTGRITVKGVKIETPDQPAQRLDLLVLDLDNSALLEQRILLSQVLLEGASLDIRQTKEGDTERLFFGPVEITPAPGKEDPQKDQPAPSAWLFGLDQLSINDFSWQARLPEQTHKLDISNGSLKKFYMWREQDFTSISLHGAINGGRFDLDTQAKPLPDTKRSELTIKLERLPLHSFTKPFLPGLKATLSTDLVISAEMTGENAKITQQGTLRLDDLAWQDDALALKQQSLSWQGDVAVDIVAGKPASIVAKGDVGGQSSDLVMPQKLQLALASFDWSGAVDLDLSNDKPLFSMQAATLALAGTRLIAAQNDHSLLQLQQLKLDGIGLAADGIADIEMITADNAKIGETESVSLSQFRQLAVNDIHFEPASLLQIGQITLVDNTLRESLSAEGAPLNVDRLMASVESLTAAGNSATETAEDEVVTEEKSAGAPLQVQVGEISLRGDNRIYFEDLGTKPVFKTEIVLEQASIKQLDTASKSMSPFDLKLALNKFTRLDLNGATNLAGGGDSANWKGELQQLEMPRLSPYSIRYTGYYLQSGQLHLSSSGKLNGGKIEGNNHIQLNRLEVEPADQERMAKFGKQLSMPLGTAIAILQDSDDNIDLDIPISGSLEDPDFGLQSVVQRLAGKGLKQAAFGILTKSLQPYATLITLAKSAADGAFITLQPVSFSPGDATLNATSIDYLAKISSMMAERKGMRLNICGQAVQQDQLQLEPLLLNENAARKKPLAVEALAEELNQRLVALAQLRSDTIKQNLLATIPGERLFSCFPVARLDDSETAPTASLGL